MTLTPTAPAAQVVVYPAITLARAPLDPRLARHLPEAAARREQVVPVERTSTALRVATLAASDALAQRLAMAAACPIELLVTVDSLEIAFGLEVVYGSPNQAEAVREEAIARNLVRLCYLDAATLSAALARRSSLPLLEQLVAERNVSDEALAEATALTLQLPYLRLGAWPVQVPLVRVLPQALAEAQEIAPIALYRGRLLVAFSHPGALPAMRAAARATGFPVAPVVANQSAIRSLLRTAWGTAAAAGTSSDAPDAAADDPPPPSTAYDVLDRRVALPAPPARLTRPFGLRSLFRRGPDLRPDPLVAGRLPAALVTQLGGLPLREDHLRVTVAVRAPLAKPVEETLELLLGLPLAATVVDEATYESLRERWFLESPEAPGVIWPEQWWTDDEPFESFLLSLGYLSRDQSEAVQRRRSESQRASVRTLLLQTGILSEDALAEALGLWLGVPWIQVEQWIPEPDVPQLLPPEFARRHGLLPLARSGSGLLVAAAAPDNRAVLAELARTAQASLRVAVATRASLARALQRWFGESDTELSVEFVRVTETLVRDGQLTPGDRAWLAEMHLRSSEPPDRTAVRLELLTEEAFTRATAAALGLRYVELTPEEHFVPGVDPLGRAVTVRRLEDPVQAGAARRLTEQQARHATAIPVREEQGRLVVAVAWPSAEYLSSLRVVLDEDFEVAVARRSHVEAAIARRLGRPRLGDALLAAGLVRQDQIDAAAALAERTAMRLGESLVSLGYITEPQLTSYLAEQYNMPFFDLQGTVLDSDTARLAPQGFCRERRVLPLSCEDDQLVLAVVYPQDRDAIDEVERLTGRRVQPVLVTATEFGVAFQSLYRDDNLRASASDLMTRTPDDSASRVLSDGQKAVFLGLLVLSVPLFAWQPLGFLTALVVLINLFYLTISFYKFYLIFKALGNSLEIPITPTDIAALDERDLPVYTILIPLYKETEVLPTLVEAIGRLDYPKAKLDVKLLLEEDDVETVRVAKASRLPAHFQIVVVPNSRPKGKPKACNYGLLHARGTYTVIFDAEDAPDPDQLKKVVMAFRKGSTKLGCVQCKLNYYNQDQNLLTRWFTAEYSMWFDLFLPGLDAAHAPIPLGGTSNHFPTIVLQELGAWDPYNVTEDADLGIRLFKRGYTTAVVDSTTYEEANSDVYNWIRQRSRWVKGYIQTWLVHMRDPVGLYRAVGFAGFFSIQMTIFGTFFTFLVNPIFWALTGLWFLSRWALIGDLFPGPIFYVGSVTLFLGNFLFTYMMMMGCMYRGYYSLIKYNAIVALYWYLMSFAAWKGFLQLMHNPFYWEKTTHGLYKGQVFQSGPGQQPGAK